MCAGNEFQVEGADTEKARQEKLLICIRHTDTVQACKLANSNSLSSPPALNNLVDRLYLVPSGTKVCRKL